MHRPSHWIQLLTTLIAGVFLSLVTLGNALANTQNLNETQSHDQIYQLIFQHIKQNIDQKLIDPSINIRPLPTSVQLPVCQSPLEIEQRDSEQFFGRITINVNCITPSWRVFISVDVDGKAPAVISTKAIIANAVISDEDIRIAHIPINQIRKGTLNDTADAIGKRAKRGIGPNRVINVNQLETPYWVIDKQEVTLISRINGLEIKASGTALDNGAQHDQVSVRNNSSDIVVKGIVIAPNTVLIP